VTTPVGIAAASSLPSWCILTGTVHLPGTAGLPAPMLLGIAFALAGALALTPLLRRLALRLGAVAHPGPGHIHRRPVAYLGGVGIFAGFVLGVAALFLFGAPFVGGDGGRIKGLLEGGLLILALGVLDDLGPLWARRAPFLADAEGRGMRPAVKLAGQVGAALILCAHGATIVDMHVPFSRDVCAYFAFGWAAWPLTVLWVVAVTNAVNLVDGLDGLAAGVSGISAATLLAVALGAHMWAAAWASAALLGGCLGFLPFNFHPARIFMGDAGALFLGFALSAIAVIGPLKGPTTVTLAVPALAVGLPVIDTVMAIVRRWRGGQMVGTRDEAHVHHRLLRLGLSHRDAVLALYAVSGWLGVSAIAVENLTPLIGGLVLLFVVATAVLAARLAGWAGAKRGVDASPSPSVQA